MSNNTHGANELLLGSLGDISSEKRRELLEPMVAEDRFRGPETETHVLEEFIADVKSFSRTILELASKRANTSSTTAADRRMDDAWQRWRRILPGTSVACYVEDGRMTHIDFLEARMMAWV